MNIPLSVLWLIQMPLGFIFITELCHICLVSNADIV